MDPHHRSPEYNLLHLAGPRLLVSGHGRSLPLTTKLATLAVAAGAASYAHLFSSLARAAVHRGLPAAALTFYRCHLAVAKACADLSALRAGTCVHAHAILSSSGSAPLHTPNAVNSLLHASCWMQFVTETWGVAWNAMISGYEQNGLAEGAIKVYKEMPIISPLDPYANSIDLPEASGAEPERCCHFGKAPRDCSTNS